MTEMELSLSFVAEFDLQRCLNMLREGYKNKQFDEAFRSHLKTYVPAIFKSFVNWNGMTSHETKLAEKLIVRVFKAFISDDSFSNLFANLKEAEPPSNICARVFKLGEPNYSCRDCGIDPTCVFCIDCFQNSAHKHHKYRMSTSGGGGYCDCGDREAWKSDPFCDKHRPDEIPLKNKDPLEAATKDRLGALLTSMNEYILEMFTLEDLSSLPPSFQGSAPCNIKGSDKFLTMLYNDEMHTYDQVTKALRNSISCSENEAVEYATIVDREGRAIVRVGSHAECHKVKSDIEGARFSRGANVVQNMDRRPLKVAVMCPEVFAHQTFASYLVQWIKSLIENYGIIRDFYAELSLQCKSQPCIVQRTILQETVMWKSVRNQLRQLFMTGIFMNMKLKKEFSIIFTRIYDLLIDHHVTDDHDINYSALSESVQIFTVPSLCFPVLCDTYLQDHTMHFKCSFISLALQLFSTKSLAKFLITEHNLLKILFDTFYKECELMIRDGVFKPDIQDPYSRFKRSLCILQDIKYALLLPPEKGDWNAKLTINFLDAFKGFLKILDLVEGMDGTTRQVEHHIEFELEWEHAFNFQFRTMDLYALMTSWCKSDESILECSIGMCIKILLEKKVPHDTFYTDSVQVGEHKLEGIKSIDFVLNKVSIHHPLVRMLIGLFVGYNFNFHHNNKPFSEYLHKEGGDITFGKIKLTEEKILELWRPVMLTAVFEAQVYARMWIRNGLVVQNQVFYYRNIRSRASMFDMDCLCMQFAASLLPPNDFLIMLIYSFGLSKWVKMEYDTELTPDEAMKQIIVLAECFFSWLLIILCERYVEGVGDVTFRDIVQYEVIHNLCIQPMAFSELNNSFSDVIRHPDKDQDLEKLIKEIAIFKKPTRSLGKGLFELKEEHYKYYNPYYYHYTKDEKNKAEENVRERLKKKKKDSGIYPATEHLPAFIGIFTAIPDIFQSDVFVHLVRLVLKRSTARVSKSYSEQQLEKVLFLMCYAMEEEKRKVKDGASYEFVKKCCEVSSDACPSVMTLLEKMQTTPSLQHAPIKQLNLHVYMRLKKMSDNGGHSPETTSLRGAEVTSNQDLKIRSERAKLKREQMMAKIAKQQMDFINKNKELYESAMLEDQLVDESEKMEEQCAVTEPIALGVNRSTGVNTISKQTCILCQDVQEVSWLNNAIVFGSFMQRSSVLSKDRSKPLQASNTSKVEPFFTEATLPEGIYTSTCGHAMHASCWKIFFENWRQRNNTRNRSRLFQYSYDPYFKEFLCPLCETVCNTVLPFIPSLHTLNKGNEHQNVDLSLEEWLDGILKTVENSVRQESEKDGDDSFFYVPCPLSTVTKMMAEGVATRFQAIFDYIIEDNSSDFSESIVDMLKKFAQGIFEKSMDLASDVNDERVITTLWNTCSFTILSIENALRAENKSLFGGLPSRQSECIGTLIRVAAVSSVVFPNDVVKTKCIRLLSELTGNGRMRDLYRMDMFHCLVSLCLSLPTLYMDCDADAENSQAKNQPSTSQGGLSPGSKKKGKKLLATPSGRVNESNALKFILGHHMAQVMLSINEGNYEEDEMESDDVDFRRDDAMLVDESCDGVELLKTCGVLRKRARLPPVKMTSSHLSNHVKASVLPFLRSSSLFFHFLTSVPPPSKLFDNNEHEFETICEYLDLPTNLSSIFIQSAKLSEAVIKLCQSFDIDPNEQLDSSQQLVESRKKHPKMSRNVDLLDDQQPCTSTAIFPHHVKKISYVITFPRKPNKLLELPVHYNQLIDKFSMFTCPKFNTADESRSPAMCLVCGTIVCSQSYCCQVKVDNLDIGAAMAHSFSCGAGTGIFIRVRDCQVMMLHGMGRGCFIPPPYLDEHGETDEGLKRGNPLFLCQERYEQLQKLWWNHLIVEDIVHKLELKPQLTNMYDWQHF